MKNTNPPQLLLRFFRWFCDPYMAEHLEGDLLERFEKRQLEHGSAKAKFLFAKDVLLLLRPGIVRSFKGYQKLNYYDMFKHNLIITLRSFVRHKSSFIINLLGLTTGLACVLLIYLWVNDELLVDGFHENKESLYHIMSNHTDASGTFTIKGTPGLLHEEIKNQVPEVQWAAVYTDPHEYTVSVSGSAPLSLKVQGRFANQEYLSAFSFPLKAGQSQSLLSSNYDALITESLAERLFPNQDALGQTIEWHFRGSKTEFKVSGVLENIPQNSSEQFELILPWNYFHDELITYKQWGNYYARQSVVIGPGSSAEVVGQKIDAIFKANLPDTRVELFLSPYTDLYLHGKFINGEQAGGRIESVRLLSFIALLILLIACINFINLTTARASQRMKEVGVKKSLGATRQSLAYQFLTESVLLCALATLLAFLLVFLLLPEFNHITQKNISLVFSPQLLVAATVLLLVVGLLAGSYPALHLSRLKALLILKGFKATNNSSGIGRKALVVFQFALSTVLIVSVVVIFRQMELVQTKNLGYDRNNLIYFEREGQLTDQYEAFLAELKNLPGVENAAVSGFMVGGMNSTGGVGWKGKTDEDQIQFWEYNAGLNSVELLGVEFLKGRGFSEEFKTNENGVIFNETAIKAMGMEDPIGKTVYHYTGQKQIVGIVKDFSIASIHKPAEPALFLYRPESTHFIMARINGEQTSTTLQQIEKLYSQFNPEVPFKPIFVDQDYQALYASEQRMAVLSRYSAILAILISCLGLFGLTAYTTEKRVKEISIRKVLGSGVWRIIVLLTGQFSILVGLGIIIALPLSYWAAQQWLSDFAYQIELKWWFFVLAGLGTLLLAWLTVFGQTFKAARVNPATNLRNE
ncbi:ABC transporter permease [Roseivirga sp. UBA1976]|uniref:ABC transporter permease n=1 Tax=Roseivirga sp. UBA1976 TaxID=1947386 RepID=UPI00257B2F9B|nr:ABC transporter permease [Roseivirga sp. UBA1976]